LAFQIKTIFYKFRNSSVKY